MTPPKVSYVVASYNHEEYVEALLRSILTQTYEDLEIILVDDGSTDGTLARARGVAATDGRLQVYAQENRGVMHARSRGIDLARGEYLSILDSDDLLPAERTRWMVDALEADAAAVLVYGDAWIIDREGRRLRRFFDADPPVPGDFSVELFCHYCFVPGTSVLVRRTSLDKSGPFWGPPRNTDYLKWIELGLLGRVVCLPDRQLSCWRLHGANQSAPRSPADAAEIYRQLRESLQQLAERHSGLARRIGDARVRSTYARCHFYAGVHSALGRSWSEARTDFARAYRYQPSLRHAAGWISSLPLMNVLSHPAYRGFQSARSLRRGWIR